MAQESFALKIERLITLAIEFITFFRRSMAAMLFHVPPRKQFVHHAVDAGVGSVVLVILLIVFAGMGLSVQGYAAFIRFGGHDLLGTFVGIGGIRELYPVMSGIIVGARVGANLAASLANMQISEQVEALEVMGLDPMRYLVAPRMWAVTLMVPLLCGFAIVIGLGASWATAVYQLGLNSGTFMDQVAALTTWTDLAAGLLKGLVFGWLVAVIACFHGFRASKRDGAEGVGVATNRAIVHASVVCIVANMLLSALLYT